MRRRRTRIIALVLVAGLIAVYWRGRRERIDLAPAAAPSETSQRPVTDRPPVAADVAMPGNAIETFHRLQPCAYAAFELAAANLLANCSEYEGKPQFEASYAQCLNGWMHARERKAAAETTLSTCGELSDIHERYDAAMVQAAKAGDADAQLCYLLAEDVDLGEYERLAPGFVEGALHRGDWRIAELLTRSSFHPGFQPQRSIEGIGKPETIYKMTKLLRLGASGEYAQSLDYTLNGMIHPDLMPEAALPRDVITRGDSWARQTFNEYFSGVPGLTERPNVCGPPLPEIGSLPLP